MEKRKPSVSKSSTLPTDYLKMVEEVFTAHFNDGLKIYQKYRAGARFEAHGTVFSDEIVLSVSLTSPDEVWATTVHASSDFDSKASAPTVQDILSICVDAAGSVFGIILRAENPDLIAQVAEEPVTSLDNLPLVWTLLETDHQKIYVKLDRTNPRLDDMADDWLRKHDPEEQKKEDKDESETENLFFTGPKKKLDS